MEEFFDEDVEINWVLSVSSDPTSYEEAITDSKWKDVMNAEIKSIEKNNTWYLTELPVGVKMIGVKKGLQDKVQ